jgi:hypothetical protein
MAGYKKNLELLRKELGGEPVTASVFGTYEASFAGQDTVRSGVLAATHKRVVFFAKKLGGYDFESFPYGNISSVERSKGMLGHVITLHASGNEVRLKWIQDGDISKFVSTVDSRIGNKQASTASTSSASPPKSSPSDIPSQIKELAALKDQGVLSEQEFEKKKAELLAKM